MLRHRGVFPFPACRRWRRWRCCDHVRVVIEWDIFRHRYRWSALGAYDIMISGWELTRASCQDRIGEVLAARYLWLQGVKAATSGCRWYCLYSLPVATKDHQVREGIAA